MPSPASGGRCSSPATRPAPGGRSRRSPSSAGPADSAELLAPRRARVQRRPGGLRGSAVRTASDRSPRGGRPRPRRHADARLRAPTCWPGCRWRCRCPRPRRAAPRARRGGRGARPGERGPPRPRSLPRRPLRRDRRPDARGRARCRGLRDHRHRRGRRPTGRSSCSAGGCDSSPGSSAATSTAWRPRSVRSRGGPRPSATRSTPWYVPLWRGQAALTVGDVDTAERLADEAEMLGRAAGSTNGPVLASVLRLVALWQRGEYARAVEMLAALGDIDPELPTYITALGSIAFAHVQAGDMVAAQGAARPHQRRRPGGDGRGRRVDGEHGQHRARRRCPRPPDPAGGVGADRAVRRPRRVRGHRRRSVRGDGPLRRRGLPRRRAASTTPWATPNGRSPSTGRSVACSPPTPCAPSHRAPRRPATARGRRRCTTRPTRPIATPGCDHLARDADSTPAGDGRGSGDNEWCRDGDVWRVAYSGTTTIVKHSKGMADLAALLSAPGREVHVTDLEGVPAAALGTARGGGARPVGRRGVPGADQRPRRRHRRGRRPPRHRSRRARPREYDALVHELTRPRSGSVAAAGRSAPSPSSGCARRSRHASATRSVTSTPCTRRLGRHLANSVRTGVFCAYRPETPTAWRCQTASGAERA